MIRTKKISTQEEIDMCVNALIFHNNTVWIPKKIAGSMRRLREGEETREKTEEKIIAAFWCRLSDYSTLPYFSYWGNLIDGLRWTEGAYEAEQSKDCVEMMPIIGRDDLDGWTRMVRIGTDLKIKFKTSGVKARMAEIMLEEGIVRYLRQGGTVCDRVEEFCETLIGGGILEPGLVWRQAVKKMFEQRRYIMKKAFLDKYADANSLFFKTEADGVLLRHFASEWLLLLDTLKIKLCTAGMKGEAEQLRLVSEMTEFAIGKEDGVSDYALHLWNLSKDGYAEQPEDIFKNGINHALFGYGGQERGLVFLESLYREVSELFREEAERAGLGKVAEGICGCLGKTLNSKNEECLYGRFLVASWLLLKTAGRGCAGGIAFYDAFEKCVHGWVGELSRYRKIYQDIANLQIEVMRQISSAFSPSGQLWPYEQTWYHIRRNGLDQPADGVFFQAGF